MTDSPPTVRAAHARLAALRRHRPNDDAALTRARRDLVVAQAAALTAQAALMLGGAPEEAKNDATA